MLRGSQNQYQGMPQNGDPIANPLTGHITPAWYRFLVNLWRQTGGAALEAGKALALTGSQEAGVFVEDFLQGVTIGQVVLVGTKGAEQVQTVSVSPWTFAAPQAGTLVAESGKLEVSRNSVDWYSVGLMGGAIALQLGDLARVSWFGGAPRVVFFPA